MTDSEEAHTPFRVSKDQLDALVRKYHDKQTSPPLIGVYLRDVHLIFLKQALKEHYNGLKLTQAYPYLNKDFELKRYELKLSKLYAHLANNSNKKDYNATRAVSRLKAIINRLRTISNDRKRE